MSVACVYAAPPSFQQYNFFARKDIADTTSCIAEGHRAALLRVRSALCILPRGFATEVRLLPGFALRAA